MSRFLILSIMLALLSTLQACGSKGPLTLPDNQTLRSHFTS